MMSSMKKEKETSLDVLNRILKGEGEFNKAKAGNIAISEKERNKNKKRRRK